MKGKSEDLFFALLRQGLWGEEEKLPDAEYDMQTWRGALALASEQAVLGIVADGLGIDSSVKAPMEVAIKLATTKISIEKRNNQINEKIAELKTEFSNAGVPVVVVKGQNIARCYRNPLSRTPGDIDLVVRPEDYENAKTVLKDKSDKEGDEIPNRCHYSTCEGGIEVEIHGTLHSYLSRKINAYLDHVQNELLCEGDKMPTKSAEVETLYIFIHLLQHFYRGGIGLRQFCDLARVLHFYRGTYDSEQMEKRLNSVGLIYEWKLIVSFLVNYLHLPKDDAILLEQKYDNKIEILWKYIRRVGNFGKKKKARVFNGSSKYLLRKMESFFRSFSSFLDTLVISPKNTVKFFVFYFSVGMVSVIRSE